jgi:hypothetical protein
MVLDAPGGAEEDLMIDLVFVAVMLGLFGVAVAFVRLCERMLAADGEPVVAAVTGTDDERVDA